MKYCTGIKRLDDTPAQNCWDLYLDFATRIVKEIGADIGFYNKKNPDKGLRVAALAFSCGGSQNTPLVHEILPNLEGDERIIDEGFVHAKRTMRPLYVFLPLIMKYN